MCTRVVPIGLCSWENLSFPCVGFPLAIFFFFWLFIPVPIQSAVGWRWTLGQIILSALCTLSLHVPAYPLSLFWNDKEQVGIQQNAASFLFAFLGNNIIEFIIQVPSCTAASDKWNNLLLPRTCTVTYWTSGPFCSYRRQIQTLSQMSVSIPYKLITSV